MLKPSTRRVRRDAPNHLNPATWLLRGEVAKLLNIGKESVRYLESNGTLHAVTDARGDHRFDPDEVNTFSATHPLAHGKRRSISEGELAATAFDLFNTGRTRREVVTILRITPAKADALFLEWKQDDFEIATSTKRATDERAKLEREAREQDLKRQERRKAALAMLKGAK